jgi:DNA-binding CsgD family transcriptional regulator
MLYKRHGECLPKTPEYIAWVAMKQRCFNSKNEVFEHYGGRGITVCNRWINSFENFLSDMGRRPTSKHTLGRIDNNGNYEPNNCRWETMTQQLRNRRMVKMTEANAKLVRWLRHHSRLTALEIAERFGVSRGVIYSILRNEIWK